MNWYLTVLKKYTQFSGRARRSELWYFILFTLLISLILGVIDLFLGTTSENFGKGVLGNIYSIITLLPSIAVGVRRMHDVGKSGWFILIPIYNLILYCTDGEKGPNQYGPDPKGQEAESPEALLDTNI